MADPLRINGVVEALPPSGIRAFFDLVMSMDDVISLGVGEPDFVTPQRIRESAISAIGKGCTSYTSNKGMPELLREISSFLGSRYGIAYDAQKEILVTVGVSEAMDLAMRAIIEPGDEVIVPEPCYVAYQPCVKLAGGVPVGLGTWDLPGFKMTAEAIERLVTPRTRAVVLNYPANPTGASYTRDELVALSAVIQKHDLLAISDEVYDLLSYDLAHTALPSLAGMKARTIYLNGFSKGYAMTGFRIGYACGPERLIAAMTKIHQYTMLCASIVSQMAAVEALRNGLADATDMVKEYDRRRRFLVAKLNECGLSCHMPEGAFYAFPRISATGLDGATFATRLLKEQRVAVVPGTAFGALGTPFVRMTYAASMTKIEEAARRIATFVNKR